MLFANLRFCRRLLVVGFLQMRLQRLEPQGHLGQSIVQANQIASGVTAQLCRMAEFPCMVSTYFFPKFSKVTDMVKPR